MSNTIYHKHHIVPKHMGGTDDPSNLIALTVAEHAEAHRILYEKYGRWEDKLAYMGLSGMLDHQECIQTAIREGAKKGARTTNLKRYGSTYYNTPKDHPDYISPWKRQSGYAMNVDGRKIRSKKYWYNDGQTEGQFCLNGGPENWKRGRLPKTRGKKAYNDGKKVYYLFESDPRVNTLKKGGISFKTKK